MNLILRCHVHFQRRALTLAQLPLQLFRRQIKIPRRQPVKKAQFIPRHGWDRVPPEFELIYNSSLKYYFAAFRFSIGASAVFIPLMTAIAFPEKWEHLPGFELQAFAVLGCILILTFVVTSILARQFFTRIYYQPSSGQFIAVRRSWLGLLKQLKYSQDDVVFNHGSGEKVQDATTVKIKGQKCYLMADDFISPNYYNMHFGEKEQGLVKKSYVRGPKF